MMKKMYICGLVLVFCMYAASNASLIRPDNVALEPEEPGGFFSFDLVVEASTAFKAQAFQSGFSIEGPGVLTLVPQDCAKVSENAKYWLHGNSDGVLVNNSLMFSDTPKNAEAQSLAKGSIVARYVFIWDGTIGDYKFTLDFPKSYFLKDDFITKEPININPGQFRGDSQSFIVYIPEPMSMLLLGLGGLLIRRKCV